MKFVLLKANGISEYQITYQLYHWQA